MSKFDLLSGLKEQELSQKEKFQTYNIELGFEKVTIAVPIKEAEAFEGELSNFTSVSSYELEKIAKKYSGFIQE